MINMIVVVVCAFLLAFLMFLFAATSWSYVLEGNYKAAAVDLLTGLALGVAIFVLGYLARGLL